MTRELELASAGSIGGLFRRIRPAHSSHTHTQCLNCSAQLHGRYCADCGQDADDHHRSILHLAWEAVEGFTHLDGRMAKTLPALLFHPGRLARDHIEGRRTRHVPPFRLFLISLLVFMLVLESLFHRAKPRQAPASSLHTSGPSQTTYTVAETPVGKTNIVINDMGRTDPRTGESPRSHWLREHIRRALADGEYYKLIVFDWAHRLAVLLLPILAGLLTLLYVYKRTFYVYDHLVVSMQFLSFVFLLFAVAWLVPGALRGWALAATTLWTPVNLFMLLRGAYGSSIVGAAAKTVFLSLATLILFTALLVGLLTLALGQM